jgi:hypothetical protein
MSGQFFPPPQRASPILEGTTAMGWIDKLRASAKAQPAHRRVDNALPTEYARKAIAGRGAEPADRGVLLDANTTAEIKRRQVSLIDQVGELVIRNC